MPIALLHPQRPAIVFATVVSLAMHLLLLAVPIGNITHYPKKAGALSVNINSPTTTQSPAAGVPPEFVPADTRNHFSSIPEPTLPSTPGPISNTSKSNGSRDTVIPDAEKKQPRGEKYPPQISDQSAPVPTAYFRADELTTPPTMMGRLDLDTIAATETPKKRGGIIALRVFVNSVGLIDEITVLENSLPLNLETSIIESLRTVHFAPGRLGTKSVSSQIDYEFDIGNLSITRSRSSDGTIWSSGMKAATEKGD